MSDRVLVTGISGFLGGHIALKLLEAGFAVRGSVRSLSRGEKVRRMLARHGADPARLELVELDLTSDRNWDAAADGVRFLQHTASPFTIVPPRDRMALIRPAVEGTERALRAAFRAGVERIVLTSSMAAIAYGHERRKEGPFTAADWTQLGGQGVGAYIESKTRAERRAWELMDEAGRKQDLVTINPSVITGPLLDEDPGISVGLLRRLLDGSLPAVPRVSLSVVDVRDVAEAHVLAMMATGVGGKRLPMSQGTVFLPEAARLLRKALPKGTARGPRWTIPDTLVRFAGLFGRELRAFARDLGVRRELDSREAVSLLGHPLLPLSRSLADSAASLMAHGLIGPRRK